MSATPESKSGARAISVRKVSAFGDTFDDGISRSHSLAVSKSGARPMSALKTSLFGRTPRLPISASQPTAVA